MAASCFEEVDSSSEASSSTPSSVPQAPVTVDSKTLDAFQHLLQDVITKEAVTEKTDLATLYGYDHSIIDNRLLKNLTGVSDPRVPCSMVTTDGTQYPPGEKTGTRSYSLHFRFNKLLFAPCARLECNFKTYSFILEFHFSPCGSKQLSTFQWQDTEEGDEIISFDAEGATCEGLNFAKIDDPKLNKDQQAIYNVLRGLVTGTSREPLQFHMQLSGLGGQSLKQLQQLRSVLPGGSGATISSIGVPEYSCYPSNIKECSMAVRKPSRILAGSHPPPMVPLRTGDTISSLAEFAVQHTVSASMLDWESQTALHEFSRADNQVTVYRSGKYAVIAMTFGSIPNTGGPGRPSKIRLPKTLEIDIKFIVPGKGVCSFKAHHESSPLDLPDFDARFIVADHSPSWFGDAAHEPDKPPTWTADVLEVLPHENSFLFNSQLEAIEVFKEPAYSEWHTIFLNQLHSPLIKGDVFSGLKASPDKLAGALKWLRECKPWNEQQAKIIEAIHETKGKLVLGTGMAGSGQGMLNLALAIFCVKLGGNAVITGTSNACADASVNGIEEFEDVVAQEKMRIYRIYTGQRKTRLQDMTVQQASLRRAGHQGGNVTSINSLKFDMLEKKSDAQAQECSLTQGVLNEADKRELSWPCYLRYGGAGRFQVDAWDVLRECLEADRNGDFDWKHNPSFHRYRTSFEECKRHLLRIADIVVCTNGNVRCREMEIHADEVRKKGTAFLGVFSDECGKELEINLVNLITAPFARRPDLYVFQGDERQLPPVNTCAQGLQEFNPFNSRLNTTLLGRLIRQGFPHVQLHVQERMHPVLSKAPGREFYDGLLKDAPKVHRPLEEVKPGLTKVLHEIIAAPKSDTAREEYLDSATDDQARLHWIEMPTSEPVSDNRGSIAVPAHAQVFFEQIFPSLQSFFGADMNREVIVMAAYTSAWNMYERRIFQLTKQQKLPSSHYPKVLTIESAQSHSATMVIFDGSMMYNELPGFLTDKGRCNAAMTRATDVFWILGGPLTSKPGKFGTGGSSPFVRLKREMEANGQVHRFKPKPKPQEQMSSGSARGRGGFSRGCGPFFRG